MRRRGVLSLVVVGVLCAGSASATSAKPRPDAYPYLRFEQRLYQARYLAFVRPAWTGRIGVGQRILTGPGQAGTEVDVVVRGLRGIRRTAAVTTRPDAQRAIIYVFGRCRQVETQTLAGERRLLRCLRRV